MSDHINDLSSVKDQSFLKKIVLNITIAFVVVNVSDFLINGVITKSSIELPDNLIGVISLFFAMCISSYYLNTKHPLSLNKLGLNKENQKKLLVYGLTGGAILLAINSPFRNGLDAIILEKYLVDPKEGYLTVLFFLIIVIALIPIVEEIFFRGFIFRIARISFNKFWGFIISSSLFAVGHGLSLSAFISSLILCYLFEKTKIVSTCIIAHILWNLGWFGVKYYMAYNS